MNGSGESPPGIEVLPAAPREEPVLANLLELYAHDFSEITGLRLQPDGRFGYPELPRYWREERLHPFLVRVGGDLAGFALVSRGSRISGDPRVWDMAEFFVARGYRKRGIGAAAAREVWRRFPGPWEVRVMEINHPARAFWRAAVASFAGPGSGRRHDRGAGEAVGGVLLRVPRRGRSEVKQPEDRAPRAGPIRCGAFGCAGSVEPRPGAHRGEVRGRETSRRRDARAEAASGTVRLEFAGPRTPAALCWALGRHGRRHAALVGARPGPSGS